LAGWTAPWALLARAAQHAEGDCEGDDEYPPPSHLPIRPNVGIVVKKSLVPIHKWGKGKEEWAPG
jgi:hypothetical protein